MHIWSIPAGFSAGLRKSVPANDFQDFRSGRLLFACLLELSVARFQFAL